MRDSTEDWCDSIDAAFFSGDEFYDTKALEEIKFYLGRWNRKVLEIEETLKEINEEEKN